MCNILNTQWNYLLLHNVHTDHYICNNFMCNILNIQWITRYLLHYVHTTPSLTGFVTKVFLYSIFLYLWFQCINILFLQCISGVIIDCQNDNKETSTNDMIFINSLLHINECTAIVLSFNKTYKRCTRFDEMQWDI